MTIVSDAGPLMALTKVGGLDALFHLFPTILTPPAVFEELVRRLACYPPGMAWISATTLDDKNANLHISQIAAIMDRVAGRPQEGSVVYLAGATPLEVKESPAQLLRAIETEEHPENPPVPPGQAW